MRVAVRFAVLILSQIIFIPTFCFCATLEDLDCQKLESFNVSVEPLRSGTQSASGLRLKRSLKSKISFQSQSISGRTVNLEKPVPFARCQAWGNKARQTLTKINDIITAQTREPASSASNHCVQIMRVSFRVIGNESDKDASYEQQYCVTGMKADALNTLLHRFYESTEGQWF